MCVLDITYSILITLITFQNHLSQQQKKLFGNVQVLEPKIGLIEREKEKQTPCRVEPIAPQTKSVYKTPVVSNFGNLMTLMKKVVVFGNAGTVESLDPKS